MVVVPWVMGLIASIVKSSGVPVVIAIQNFWSMLYGLPRCFPKIGPKLATNSVALLFSSSLTFLKVIHTGIFIPIGFTGSKLGIQGCIMHVLHLELCGVSIKIFCIIASCLVPSWKNLPLSSLPTLHSSLSSAESVDAHSLATCVD
jgi:hypothetical protein